MSARPWQDSQTVDQVLINADLEQEAARARVADEPLARLWQAARWLIYDSDIHASEIACALGALVWVVVLALRPHLFDTNQNYNALAAITHESYVMATALGLLGLNAAGLVAYALSLDDLAVVRVRRVAILLYGGFFFAGFADRPRHHDGIPAYRRHHRGVGLLATRQTGTPARAKGVMRWAWTRQSRRRCGAAYLSSLSRQ
jgi:hypothetical protein